MFCSDNESRRLADLLHPVAVRLPANELGLLAGGDVVDADGRHALRLGRQVLPRPGYSKG